MADKKMINIIYSDESAHLTIEICNLLQQAANETLNLEFKEELAALGLALEDLETEIGVTVVDDEEIRGLNRDYRGNDKVTDVLSFPQYEGHDEILAEMSSVEEGAALLLGDVVICYDQAVRQADEYGTGTTREIVYLFVHSMMHLLGYDHMEEDEKKEMREKEEEVLSVIGISR